MAAYPAVPSQKQYDAMSIHDKSLTIEKWLEQLATELAHSGVDQGTTDVITKMADVMRRIVAATGGGQAQPQEQAAPAPAQPQEQPPQQPQDIHSATVALRQHMQAARAARG